jgi:cytidylate kinase
VDREVFLWAAQEAGVSPETIEEAERAPSFLESMIERMGSYLDTDAAMEMGATYPNLSVVTSDTYRQLIQGVIWNIAETRDAVILGHGSHVILKDHPEVLRVYLSAPMAVRIARIGETMNLDPTRAEKHVRENDVTRRNFFEEHLKVKRNEAQNYDLCLRTDKLSFEACTDLICRCFGEMYPAL